MGFNIVVNRGHAVLLRNMIEHTRKNIPSEFMPEEIIQIEHQINEMLDKGCFKHGILCTEFTNRIEGNVPESRISVICKQCEPKLYNQYMRRVKEGLATMEE